MPGYLDSAVQVSFSHTLLLSQSRIPFRLAESIHTLALLREVNHCQIKVIERLLLKVFFVFSLGP